MKVVPRVVLSLIVASLLAMLCGCGKQNPNLAAYRAAESNLWNAYEGFDPKVSEAGLLAYREKVIQTKGFDGLMQVPHTLGIAEARLFVLKSHLGDEASAERWFQSARSNLLVARDMTRKYRRNQPDYQETEITKEGLNSAIIKMDTQINPPMGWWKTNMVATNTLAK